MELFTSIKSAYQLVAAKLEREEEHFRYNVVSFEVVLKKGRYCSASSIPLLMPC